MKKAGSLKKALILFFGLSALFNCIPGAALVVKDEAGTKVTIGHGTMNAPKGTIIAKVTVEEVKNEKGTFTVKGEKADLVCKVTITFDNGSTKTESTLYLSFKAGQKNQDHKIKCEDPILLQLPADAHGITANFSGVSGTGSLPVKSGLSSVATIPGASLVAEPGQQLAVVSFPEDMPTGSFDLDVSFDLDSTRPVDVKLAMAAEMECDGRTYYPLMAPSGTRMADLQPITLPVSDELVPTELPFGDLPEEVVIEIECPCHDTTAPTCAMTGSGTDSSGRKFINVTAQDTDSGLESILATRKDNTEVDIPLFDSGDNDPQVVTATKQISGLSSFVELAVTDVCENVTHCDPAISLEVRETGKPVIRTFGDIPRTEHYVTIWNGDPGLTSLDIVVNGQKFKVPGTGQSQEMTLDVGAAMLPAGNVVTLRAAGRPGSSALVVISDSSGLLE